MLPSEYIRQEHELILRILYCCEKVNAEYNDTNKLAIEILNKISLFFSEFIEQLHHKSEDDYFFSAIENKNLDIKQYRVFKELKSEHIASEDSLNKILVLDKILYKNDTQITSDYLTLLEEYVYGYYSHITKEDCFFFPDTEKLFTHVELIALQEHYTFERIEKIIYFENFISNIENYLGINFNTDSRIRYKKRHPYIVENVSTLTDSNKNSLPVFNSIALCRCGASKLKPYCDNSHITADYETEKDKYRARDKSISYVGKGITIHDNRGVCSHDKTCSRELPEVFKEFETRWIDPNAAPKEKIIDICNRCPSGALSYSINNIKHAEIKRAPAIIFAKDSSIEVQGYIALEDDMQSTPESKEHYTLCRCGQTENTPFCSGVHLQNDFCDSCEEF